MKSICKAMFRVLFVIMLLVSPYASRSVIGIRKIEIARKAFEEQFEREVASRKNSYPTRLAPGGPDSHHH